MTIDKITNAPTPNEQIDKINEIIDNINSSGGDVFVATYGTTTLSEATTAYNEGKTLFAKNTSGYIARMIIGDNSGFTFEILNSMAGTGTTITRPLMGIWTLNSSGWSSASAYLEVTGNKVTSLSSSSTDTQYPSAKCVYNSLSNKIDTSSLTEVKCVVTTYSNGTSWYRIWSDGWCEQGGRVTNAGSSGTVTMLQSYASLNYTLVCQEGSTTDFGGTDSDTAGYAENIGVTDGTVNSFRYSITSGRYFNWYACGYLYY